MGKPFWVVLKTKDGRCTTPVVQPFRTQKVCAVVRRHRFVGPDKTEGDFVPAGMFYMTDLSLAKQTKGRATSKRYRDLYDLFRAQCHISDGEDAETEDLDLKASDIRATAQFVRISGGMNDQERDELVGRLAELGRTFGDPKRLPEKRLASKHLGTAARLREDGRRRIAPAARCAYAAATRIDQRLKTLDGMAPFFTRLGVSVYRVIREYRETVHRAWMFFAKSPSSDGNAMRKIVKETVASFDAMALRPYRDVAKLIAIHLRWLDFELAERDMKAVGVRINEIVRALRRLRMVEYLETDLIGPLAFYLDRPRAKRGDPWTFRDGYLAKSAKAMKRIRALTGEELDSAIVASVQSQLDLVETELRKESPRFAAAKDRLKSASETLATVETFPRSPYPFLAEMA